MPLINVLCIIAVLGVVLWLINRYIPMEPNVKYILNIAAVIGIVLWLLNVFGLFAGLNSVRVGH